MNFEEVSQEFKNKWGVDSVPDLDAKNNALSLKETIGIYLPNHLTLFHERYGNLYTPNILDAVCKLNESEEKTKEVFDIQNFIALNEIVSATKNYIEAGMPAGFIAFANDCMGNLFLIKKNDCLSEIEDCNIYVFDHNFITIEKEYESLTDMLIFFNSLNKT